MAPPTIIEIAKRDDAEAILQLQRLAYQSEAELYQDWDIPPLKESLEELLAEFDRQIFLKAFYDDLPCIVGSVRARFQDNTCCIGRLIVHPRFERRGIGSALMRQIELHFPQAQRFELFTGHRSSRNLLFYQRLGYVPFRQQRLSSHVTFVFLQKPSPNGQR
jgi:GNAT superfamily N-acetyltransferase